MGFFGVMLLARLDGSLLEVPAVAAVAPGRDRADFALAGGWRTAWVHRGEETNMVALADELTVVTAAPVIASYVLDDDFAMVFAVSPGGVRHHFYINTVTALSSFEEWDEVPEPPTTLETVEALAAWAAEVGLVADEAGLANAVEQNLFPDGLDPLYRALGIDDGSSAS